MKDPILVTGAAGFIGFSVSKALLARGEKVVGIDNLNDYYDVSLKEDRLEILKKDDNFTFIKVDISDYEALGGVWNSNGPFKRVIHLAAQAGVRYSLENPFAYVQSNLVGHVNILELCRHTEGFEHLVYASSSSVYGGNKKAPHSVSDRVDNPVSLYAATKRCDELMSESYGHLYQIQQTGLRFFTVYGPWGRPDMSPYIFATAISKGKKLPIYNKGDMRRDFTYIDDIVAGVILALDTPPQKYDHEKPHVVFNLGNNKSENLLEFVGTFEKAFGVTAEKEMLPMQKGDVLETFADIDETTKRLGYKPTTTIAEGIPRYVEWFKNYYTDS